MKGIKIFLKKKQTKNAREHYKNFSEDEKQKLFGNRKDLLKFRKTKMRYGYY